MSIEQIKPYFLIYEGDEELTKDLKNYELEISDSVYNDDKKENGERMIFCKIEKVDKSNKYKCKLTKKKDDPADMLTFNQFCEEVEKNKPDKLFMFSCRKKATGDMFLSSSDLLKLKKDIESKKYSSNDVWKNIIVICPIALCCVSDNEFATTPTFLGSSHELDPTPLILNYDYNISKSKDLTAFDKKIRSFFLEHAHQGTQKFRHRICSFIELVDEYIEALTILVEKYHLIELLIEMRKVNTLGEPHEK